MHTRHDVNDVVRPPLDFGDLFAENGEGDCKVIDAQAVAVVSIKEIARIEVDAVGKPATVGILFGEDDDAAVAAKNYFVRFLVFAIAMP